MTGRNSKYNSDMPARVRALLSEGYSQAACAGKLGISAATLYEWRHSHPEFLEAIKEGEAASQTWWEDRGRDACLNGEFNAGVWWRNMQNRFGWRDKVENDTKVSLSDDLKKRFEEATKSDGDTG